MSDKHSIYLSFIITLIDFFLSSFFMCPDPMISEPTSQSGGLITIGISSMGETQLFCLLYFSSIAILRDAIRLYLDVHVIRSFQFCLSVTSFLFYLFSSADPKVSSAELMVLLICPSSVVRRRPSSSVVRRRPSSVVVRPSTFALNRYSSYSSYLIILNFLLEKLGI